MNKLKAYVDNSIKLIINKIRFVKKSTNTNSTARG
ncbi:hypothetical protein RDI58_010439 [Solanum bulbocastanum]|uniref:Uncharacterized protein n=1 Tax=Solanum bulbocastanum TaxID=147425 RepID=A0AAN8TMX8_SOLBU